MWQIAATAGIAHQMGEDWRIPESWSYRPFFSIPDERFGSQDGTDAADLATDIDERARTYLQDLSLFAGAEAEVRAMFAPSGLAQEAVAACLDFGALPQPILSVHVRRGDNVQANDPGIPNKHLYHPLRPLSYYLESIEELTPAAASVAVFSDDPEWCRANIPADYYGEGRVRAKEHLPGYAADGPCDWLDIFLMAQCQGGHVISNSSFAWWGAFLSGDPAPVYPWPFFGPLVSEYTDAGRMFPAGWRRKEHATGGN